ncbi:MAG: hypothetical protein RLZZ127_440 [Planctomycetota bacterium]|jgi:glycosyltransferase involved in cell wall biosynthesis
MTQPLVSGLTIIRNGIRLDYPFLEAIRAALPICDEFIVVVGDSDDGTREAVAAIGDPRIRIVDSHWSPWMQPRRCLLAQQTNIGLNLCRGRWCLYVQGNEILHERSLPELRRLMEVHAEDPRIEAMLIERLTFWADYRHVFAVYPQIFKFSVRIIRPYIGAASIRDAMSFAVFDTLSTRGRYPRAIDTGQWLHRYADVHLPDKLKAKGAAVHYADKGPRPDLDDPFHVKFPRAYIRRFAGTHPAVMAGRMAGFPDQYDLDSPKCRTAMGWKERWRTWETAWYHRFGFPRRRACRYELIGDYLPKPDRPR